MICGLLTIPSIPYSFTRLVFVIDGFILRAIACDVFHLNVQTWFVHNNNHNTCPTVGHCVDGVDAYCEARALKSQHLSAFSLAAKSCESDNLKWPLVSPNNILNQPLCLKLGNMADSK